MSNRERKHHQGYERKRQKRVARDDVPQDVVLVREKRDPEVGLILQLPRAGLVEARIGAEQMCCIEQK